MSTLLRLKIALVCLLRGGGLLVLRCRHTGHPPLRNARQTATVDSLKSAAPTHKDLQLMPGIDWGSQIVDQVNALITANGGVLVHDGLLLLAWIAVFKLLLMVIPMLLRRLDLFYGNWHTTVHFSEISLLLFQIALAAFALNHWMAPLAGGLRLHQVPAALAKGLNEHLRYGHDRSACRLHPGYRDEAEPAESVAGSGHRDLSLHHILIEIGVLAAAMFVISSFGFIGVGLYTVLGPCSSRSRSPNTNATRSTRPSSLRCIDQIPSRFGPGGIRDFVTAYGHIGAITDDTK
ncbi:MAG TPA: hypothetical protein VH601_19670 [Bryobacteraceae bacterium]|jgi:hypothetical protein